MPLFDVEEAVVVPAEVHGSLRLLEQRLEPAKEAGAGPMARWRVHRVVPADDQVIRI